MAIQTFRILLALVLLAAPASQVIAAPSVEVAKQCNLLADKQFPPVQPGNPAAGLQKGTVKDARAYFKKCVDNNGKVDDAQPATK